MVVGAGGAQATFNVMGGYALAKFRFPGRKAVFVVHHRRDQRAGHRVGGSPVPPVRGVGPTNTRDMIIPSLISPFGLYLMWIFAA